MSARIADHVRSNVFAYLIVFLALTVVPAYAASKVKKNSVGSKQIKDGQVLSDDLGANAVSSAKVADNSLTGVDIDESTLTLPASGGGSSAPTGPAGGDLAGTYPTPQIANGAVSTQKIGDAQVTIPKLFFDPATQLELDALQTSDASAPNTGSNAVHWDILNGVPAGFADGTDDVGSSTATDLNCATCVAASELVDGASLTELADDDGSGSGLDADLLDGVSANAFWRLAGNAATDPAADFLGTTDNQPLNLRVNNARALRLEPASDGTNPSPNVIGGTVENTVSAGAHSATISGGGGDYFDQPTDANRVTDEGGTIGGGSANRAGDDAGTTRDAGFATVGGGLRNIASGGQATVGGGVGNTASGAWATVSGGEGNTASGSDATVAGGRGNQAAGNFSFVAGRFALNSNPNHSGVFLFSDGSPAVLQSAAANEFAALATGGFRFKTSANLSTGCDLPAGSGTFACTSDRHAKDDFAPVSPREVLGQVARMPIESWVYEGDPEAVRHIGPTAQAFKRAFEIGEDPTTISTVDADGVALAAIKGLDQRLDALSKGGPSSSSASEGSIAPVASGASLGPAAVAAIALLAAILASALTAGVALRSGRIGGRLAPG